MQQSKPQGQRRMREEAKPTHPWAIQTEALGGAYPSEEVQDEAFQVVVGEVAAPQILGAQHEGVLSHEGHGGPAASETSL